MPRRARRHAGVFPKKRFYALLISLIAYVFYLLFSPENSGELEKYFTARQYPAYAPSDSVRVCTWNVRNYNVSSRRVDKLWQSYPKPENERREVCQVLKNIDADIVLIEEMGDETFLEDLRSRLEKLGLKYAFGIVAKRDAPSRLAILSKIPPDRVFDFSYTKFAFDGGNVVSPRGTIGVKVSVADLQMYVFAVHLKSKVGARKRDEQFAPFRHAELRAISARIKSVAGSEKTLIAGDFNAEPTKSIMRNLKGYQVVPQSDSFGLNYTHYWAKKNIFYQYDFFVAANFKTLPRAVVLACPPEASDHRPVYVDIPTGLKRAQKAN